MYVATVMFGQASFWNTPKPSFSGQRIHKVLKTTHQINPSQDPLLAAVGV